MQIGALIAFLSYLIQILMSVMMATFVAVLAPRAVGVRRPHRGGARHRRRRWSRPPRRSPSSPAAGSLELRHVEFNYPGAEAPVLCDISFTAVAGETTAIIGSTGAGKTTLLNLIPRLFDATGGRGAGRRRRRAATSSPSCCGAASAWCPRSRSCSPARWPATCATATRTPPTRSCGRRSRSPRPRTSCAAMPGGLDAPDQPGRHQRLGRPAPAPRHRPGPGHAARASTCSTTRSRRSTWPPTPGSAPPWSR